jgi:hypothetical protein
MDIEVLNVEGNALQSITRGEIDMQVGTAKRYPRSIATFRSEALSMATLDQQTAEACFYALKRDGKTIEGPSVRLAEIVASCWGNLRVEGRIVADDGRFVVAQGTCWDVERNVVIRTEVRRRVTTKTGARFSDDMIAVTGNAAMSIALRNAIFRVVPFAFTNAIYESARKVAVGDEKTLAVRRGQAVAWFAKAGISSEQVLQLVGRPSLDDVKLDDLAVLQGMRTAIVEGSTTVDQLLGSLASTAPSAPAAAAGTGMDRLKAATAATAAPKVKPAAQAAPAPVDADILPLDVCPVCGTCCPELAGMLDSINGCPSCKGVQP